MAIETLRYLVGETCDVARRDDSGFYMGLRWTQRLACCMRESRRRTAHMSRQGRRLGYVNADRHGEDETSWTRV